jgi:hypothetical protein
MRTARNTQFNKLYQPNRIGHPTYKTPYSYRHHTGTNRLTKESLVQHSRRLAQSQPNRVYARYLLLKLRIAYMEINQWFRPMPSKFLLRARQKSVILHPKMSL